MENSDLLNMTYSEGNVDLILWHVGACQVHASLEAKEALTGLHHL